MNVTMPDGTTINNVPDDITQSDLLSKYNKVSDIQQTPTSSTTEQSGPLNTFGDSNFGKIASIVGNVVSPGAMKTIDLVKNHPVETAATIGSVLAPEIALPAWALRLGIASKAVSPLITNAAKIPAAALAGGAAGAGQESLNPNSTPSSILSQGLQSGAEMGTAETTGSFLGPILGKLLRPGAESMTPEGLQVLKLARESNLPISPTTVAPSAMGKIVQGTLDNFTPSKMVNDYYRRQAVTSFNRLAAELPEKEGVGKVLGNPEINTKVMSTLDEVLGATKKGLAGEAKAGREAFLETVGKDSDIALTNTLPMLKSVKADAVDPALRDVVITKLKELGKDKTLTADSLDTLMSQVGGVKVSNRADNKFLSQIKESIKSDFELAGADMSKLSESGKQFSESFAALSGKSAKQLKAAIAKGDNPASLTEKLYRQESSSLLGSLKSRLPKDVSESLDAQNLTNMIQNSMKDGPLYGMKVLDGNKLENILKTNESVMKKNYSETALKAMNNLVMLAKSSAPDINRIGGFSKGELLTGGIAGLGVAAADLNHMNLNQPKDHTGLIIAAASVPILARSMIRSNGLMNKWLTTGASEGTTNFMKQVQNLGLREAYAQ